MKLFLLLLISLFIVISSHAQDSLGIFPFSRDIGEPAMKGSAQYDNDTQVYTVKGGGYDVWYNRDEFHYLWKKMSDDFILTATFKLAGEGGNPQLKTGWMIRKETDPASAHISTAVHRSGLTVLQWRSQTGANMLLPQDEQASSKRNVQVMQLERQGDVFIMRAARYGEPLQIVGYHQMENMTGEVLAGLFVCAHDTDALGEAKIWNVRIDKTVPTNAGPRRAWRIGSRLETMDVFNGKRRIIYQTSGRIESPNWMPDGKKILFNTEGLLYTVPLSGGKPKVLNTGSANHISGAHCISRDGKMLGIGDIESRWPGIFVLPIEGGQPKVVVNEMPAYLHGLSPDNKEVAFVAPRRGLPVYDVYKKPINGGKAIRLTDSKAYEFADGCEYSPDGKYIYYNASQKGGTMQIWKMKPDGSSKEQLTFDAYNNWFPHISPDGKWMVFISFPAGTRLNTHPSYTHVMIRLMPVAGGAPRVVAYIYGGQGTLDENSWAPDSRHISFVSYTTL
ncbi:MAG TPA: hypothetical protein VFX43_10555 [Chitinophagaceae bacterium]|nr:hypothetical protein [Chitinophagaceae bacterium]